MPKTKILILCIVCSITFGCKTSKQATAIKQTANTENTTVRQSDATGNRQTASITQQADNSKVEETVDEATTIVEYSPPDSSGRQYTIKSTTITKTARRNEKKDISYKQNENTASGINISNSEKNKTKSDSTKKENTNIKTESKAPAGVSWGMIILTVGLLVLVYLVLKKYKIL
jgi:cobalamin biosynthesis Mg chelatase CobN